MKLTIRYVAALRDRLGRASEDIDSDAPLPDSDAVIAWLGERDEAARLLFHPSVRLILNDEVVARPAPVSDGDTLAFCPPFSGG